MAAVPGTIMSCAKIIEPIEMLNWDAESGGPKEACIRSGPMCKRNFEGERRNPL